MRFLAATCFGSFRPPEATAVWRAMVPGDGAVIACDGADIVGMALFLDLRLTVPGGAVLPAAGVTWVAVAPTHRRRGLLREMFVEMHRRIVDVGYPIAGLEASEAGIYGRFGYGPATIAQYLTVDRRTAQFRADVPDPGGVRVVRPAEHRDQLEDIYERWRLRIPGGLFTPRAMWDELLADRESVRRGGSKFIAMLHPDGFAMYRMRRGEKTTAEVSHFAAVTPDAHIALWRAFIGLDLFDSVTFEAPPGDPLPYLLSDPRLVRITGWEDGLWLRIVDVPAVLQARSYAADLSVVLDISDGELGGGGRFTLDVARGQARCAPTDAAADVHLDLSVLGSLYFGAHRASAFAFANRLRCNDTALIRQLDEAFATDVPAQLGYGF
jgi:predicted acetyltransferase